MDSRPQTKSGRGSFDFAVSGKTLLARVRARSVVDALASPNRLRSQSSLATSTATAVVEFATRRRGAPPSASSNSVRARGASSGTIDARSRPSASAQATLNQASGLRTTRAPALRSRQVSAQVSRGARSRSPPSSASSESRLAQQRRTASGSPPHSWMTALKSSPRPRIANPTTPRGPRATRISRSGTLSHVRASSSIAT